MTGRRSRGNAPARAAALALALAGCDAGETLDEHPCPPAGSPLTHAGGGGALLARHCGGCHAAAAPDRHGAPEHVVFDDAAQVRTWAARIFARAAGDNASMPPGPDDPPAETRAQLADWLACGAP